MIFPRYFGGLYLYAGQINYHLKRSKKAGNAYCLQFFSVYSACFLTKSFLMTFLFLFFPYIFIENILKLRGVLVKILFF